jgi:protein arginine kinase
MKKPDAIQVCTAIKDAFARVKGLRNQVYVDMGSVDMMEKEILKERHLISYDLAGKGIGSGLILAGDEHTAIMINEEDHIRMQTISPGLDLERVWKKIDAIDTESEKYLDYEFSPSLGYLTACPSNVGTGMRASVMLHLSGLKLTNDIEKVIKGLSCLGFAVRGMLGEGTDAFGNMFQISNQSTLGESEEEIIERLQKMISEVVGHELNARDRLMEKGRILVLDHIGRAQGILANARLLTSREAIDLLSVLRLGIYYGLVKDISVPLINETILLTQPGHLQKINGKILSTEERDELRSVVVRQKLKEGIKAS